jgi:large subunit ribosomal protein L9
MAKIDVILIKNVVGLGAESDQVKVAAGYARNYLFPQKLAIPLTAANKRRLEVLKVRRAQREAQELNSMTELAKALEKLTLNIAVKTGEDNKMYGSVTAGTIADELKHQFDVAIDRHKIHLEKPIRALGEYEVELKLHPEVTAKLKVVVKSSNPVPQVAELPPKVEQPTQAPKSQSQKTGKSSKKESPQT